MATIDYSTEGGGMNIARSFGEGLKFLTGTIDFDSSYPSDGEDFDVSGHFPKQVLGVMVGPQDGYVFEYDEANQKIKAYYADYDASSDGALIEVADGTDLSSVTGVRWLAFGF